MSYSGFDIPLDMKAWRLKHAGLPSDTLELVKVPVPTLATPTSVLVKVVYVALHPGTLLLAQAVPTIFRKSPAIAETDFSGIIVAMGEQVPTQRRIGNDCYFALGLRVFGTIPVPSHLNSGSGALAEFVSVDISTLVAKPDNVSLSTAAGLGVSALTAMILVDAAQLQQGGCTLVNAPCGGVGHFATQLARKAVGPEGTVVGICSSANVDLARKLGCDEAVSYNQLTCGETLADKLTEKYGLEITGGFDAVIDAYGSQLLWHNSSKYLKAGAQHPYATVGVKLTGNATIGALIHYMWRTALNSLLPALFGGVPRKYSQISVFVNKQIMERLKGEVTRGTLETHIGGSWEFEDAKDAYVALLSGHARGKLLIRVSDMEA